MNREVRIAYTLKQNDTLQKVAQCFETTVDKIVSENVHLKKNKSNVGEVITVVPGSIHNYKSQILQELIPKEEYVLTKQMRFRWQEYVFWSRATIVAILENLVDKELIAARLLENPTDIAKLFAPYYSQEIVAEIERLLQEQLSIAASLVAALRDDNSVLFNTYNEELFRNADDIARTFASINPSYDEEEIRKMMYDHLDLLIRLAAERKNKNYMQQIKNFDASHEHILMLADMFTNGIIRQFPNRF